MDILRGYIWIPHCIFVYQRAYLRMKVVFLERHGHRKAACDIGRLFGVTPNARQALKPEKKEPIKKLGVFSNKPKIA